MIVVPRLRLSVRHALPPGSRSCSSSARPAQEPATASKTLAIENSNPGSSRVLYPGGRADHDLDPAAARPPQHLHQPLVRIDDPVLPNPQPQVLLGLLLVVPLSGAGRDHLDHDLRHPAGPDFVIVLHLRRRSLVDGQIRVPLRFQLRDQQLALAAPGDGVDELWILALEIRELLADRVETTSDGEAWVHRPR